MRLVVVHVLLLVIGCDGGSSTSLLPGKKPSEVPGPALGSYDGGGDLGGEQLETAAPAPPADGPSSPPADASPPPPPPPPPADAAPAPPADVLDLPRQPSGEPWPACAPIDVNKTPPGACSSNLALFFARTSDGFICGDCAPVGKTTPCWIEAPKQHDVQGKPVGDYQACRRPWLCVPFCGDTKVCPIQRGPMCETKP